MSVQTTKRDSLHSKKRIASLKHRKSRAYTRELIKRKALWPLAALDGATIHQLSTKQFENDRPFIIPYHFNPSEYWVGWVSRSTT